MIIVGGNMEVWGYLIDFLDVDDPRPAREQFDEKYQSGWRPSPNWKFKGGKLISNYPEDPPLRPISILQFRNETIILFPASYVMILQEDTSWEVCRMD